MFYKYYINRKLNIYSLVLVDENKSSEIDLIFVWYGQIIEFVRYM